MRLRMLFLMLLLTVGASGPARDHGEMALKLDVVLDSISYSLGDEITITATLRNISDSEVVVFGRLMWGGDLGLRLIVGNQEGMRVNPFLHVGPSTHQSLTKDAAFVRLYPGHFLGVTTSFEVSSLIYEPGIYHLIVAYKAPTGAAYESASEWWGPDRPFLESANIKFEVTP